MHEWLVAYTFKKVFWLKDIFFPFSCDTFSNCLPGNSKKIKNCTIFSGPVCDGCEEGNWFNLLVGNIGGCVECSPPCNILEEETRSCTTDHDRRCTAKGPVTSPDPSKLSYLPYGTKLYLPSLPWYSVPLRLPFDYLPASWPVRYFSLISHGPCRGLNGPCRGQWPMSSG